MVIQQTFKCYAKLSGKSGEKEFSTFITALPAKLGRLTSSQTETNDGHFVDLGEGKGISRVHAILDWDASHKQYSISCQSKNGIVVGGKYYGHNAVSLLRAQIAIKMGSCNVYFLLPIDGETPASAPALPATAIAPAATASRTHTAKSATASKAPKRERAPHLPIPWVHLVLDAYGSPELRQKAADTGLLSADIADWILAHKINAMAEIGITEEDLKKHTAGIQRVLTKRCKKGSTSNEQGRRGNYWTILDSQRPAAKGRKSAGGGGGAASSANVNNTAVSPEQTYNDTSFHDANDGSQDQFDDE